MQRFRPWSVLDAKRCDLLRRTAQHCLLACSLALKQASPARSDHPEPDPDFGKPHETAPDLPYCDGSPPRWQAAMLHEMVDRLARRKARLQALATAARVLQTEAVASELSSYLALLFIPTAGFAGQWGLGADEAAEFLQRLGSLSQARPAYLRLLAVPVLWALVFAHPVLQECAGPTTTRTEQLWQARAVCDLFAVLRRLGSLPVSTCFAVGALAVVSAPPAARAWIEKARQAAQDHGARGFARFFSQVVTTC